MAGLDFTEAPSPAQAAPPAEPKKRRHRAPGEAAGTRKPEDQYDTDPAVALACVEWLSRLSAGGLPSVRDAPLRILEPTAGGGPFVKAARAVYPQSKIAAVDLLENYREPCLAAGADRFLGMNALDLPPEAIAQSDLIVSNPPFKLADDLVRHFCPNMKEGAALAFLLSVTFIAGQDRWGESGLYALAPLSFLAPIVPRPKFGMRSSPKFEAGLFVWVKGAAEAKESKGWGPAALITSPIRWK